MRVLVIGGTNFIGPHVVRQLVAAGHDITVYHTGQHEADLPERVRHVHDERARIPVSGIVDEAKAPPPDVVVHMVPVGEKDARVVMDAFRGIARRVVSISSMDVYRAYGVIHRREPGSPEPVPLSEDAPLRSTWMYQARGETPRAEDAPDRYMDDYEKILVEKVVMGDPHLPGTVLRLPMVYGPNDGRLGGHIRRMEDRRPAILLKESMAEFRSTWGYVENVAAAITLAIADERAEGRVYNVGEADAPTMAEWIRLLGRVAGWDGQVVVLPRERLPAHIAGEDTNLDQHWITDTSRIRQELGYKEPVPQEEALKRTVEWYRENPPERLDPEEADYSAEDAALAGLEH